MDAFLFDRRTDPPRFLDVCLDLTQQLLDAQERPRRPQPRQKIELDAFSIQIALETHEVGLDFSSLIAEGRVGPNIAGRGPGRSAPLNPRAGGVDSLGRHEDIDPRKVDRREAQAFPSPCPTRDKAAKSVRPAEGLQSLVHAPVTKHLTDQGRRNQPAVDQGRVNHFELDPGLQAPPAQGRDIAFAIVSEGEVRALDHAFCAELADDDLVEELPCRQLQEPGSRMEHRDFGRAGFPQQGDLTLNPDQRNRSLVRAQSATGCGSNVMARAGTPAASARAQRRPSNCWWPRCTPSKLPTVTIAPLAPAGNSRTFSIVITDVDPRRMRHDTGHPVGKPLMECHSNRDHYRHTGTSRSILAPGPNARASLTRAADESRTLGVIATR